MEAYIKLFVVVFIGIVVLVVIILGVAYIGRRITTKGWVGSIDKKGE